MIQEVSKKEEVMISLFGDDTRFAGFKGIVTKLVVEGGCLSTVTATKMNFGLMERFISSSKEDLDGLSYITFDREKAYESEEFLIAKEKELKKLMGEAAEIRQKLISIEKLIDKLSR